MGQLRQNIITRDWVVIATERAKRPDQFACEPQVEQASSAHDAGCPFCPGNEKMANHEWFHVMHNGAWKIRVIPNKFPAVTPIGDVTRKVDGIHRSMDAVGFHDVVIEHPTHNFTLIDMTEEEVANILSAYKQRYQKLNNDKRIESIIIFRNHGKSAGTSLVHPHSQIVAMPVVPYQLRTRIDIARNFYDDHGECIFCRTLKDELAAQERIVYETKHFVAFIPYAALSPFHLWIFPKRHEASFEEIREEEISDLAHNLQTILRKLSKGLNNPDYNYTIRSIPVHEHNSDYFHWYLAIVPRVAIAAGFELGSGTFISTAIPEESAEFLRNVVV